MRTNLDTGEHTAELVELTSEPRVVAGQAAPAIPKEIQGRSMDVDVLDSGELRFKPKERIGPHHIIESGQEILPSPDAATDGIIAEAAAEEAPTQSSGVGNDAESTSEALLAEAAQSDKVVDSEDPFAELNDEAAIISEASDVKEDVATDTLMDDANSVIDESATNAFEEEAADEDEDLMAEDTANTTKSAGAILGGLVNKLGDSQPPALAPETEEAQAQPQSAEAQMQSENEQQPIDSGQQATDGEQQPVDSAQQDTPQQDESLDALQEDLTSDSPEALLGSEDEQEERPQEEKKGGILGGLLGGDSEQQKGKYRSVSDAKVDVVPAGAAGLKGETEARFLKRFRKREKEDAKYVKRQPNQPIYRRGGGRGSHSGMRPRI